MNQEQVRSSLKKSEPFKDGRKRSGLDPAEPDHICANLLVFFITKMTWFTWFS